VENTDTRQGNGAPKSYWIATIIRLNGYKTLIRYEGFNEDASKDFWMNIADEGVYHIGYCASLKSLSSIPELFRFTILKLISLDRLFSFSLIFGRESRKAH